MRQLILRAVLILIVLAVGGLPVAAQRAASVPVSANRAVYLDNQGVVRWQGDKREVTLFGANYVLPTASAYRAAGYVHGDRKQMIAADMAHFPRMGWDCRRLAFSDHRDASA